MKASELTFRIVDHLQATGQWATINQLARALEVTPRAVRVHVKFLGHEGVLECCPLFHEHRFRVCELPPEFEARLGLWREMQGVTNA